MYEDDPPLETLPLALKLAVQEYYVWRDRLERARRATGGAERRQARRWQRHQPVMAPVAPHVPPRDWLRVSPKRKWRRTGRTWR